MGRWLLWLMALVALLALSACAAKEKATPAPASPTVGAKAPWEEEWERVVVAARREGKVAVLGPAGTAQRETLERAFEKAFPGIDVEYLGESGSVHARRLVEERKASIYSADVYIGGTTTAIGDLISAGMGDPLKPALILPEVTETKNWRDGRLEFADSARAYNLAPMPYPKTLIAYNKQAVDPKELRSLRDLLNPKWKGKLATMDPRIAGSGNATFFFYWVHPNLGEAFIGQLAAQEVRLTRDQRQIAEWVAQGAVAMAIGFGEDDMLAFAREGAPIGMIQGLEEGSPLVSGSTSVLLINKAPHPNAAKLYINWYLSKEGQTLMSQATGFPSLRLDVGGQYAPEHARYQAGVKYDITTYDEAAVKRKDEFVQMLGKYFK